MKPIFEQLPNESAKAFAAFKTYLDLGSERSLATTAAQLGKSKVLMERWSRKYDWVARIKAHATYRADLERTMLESLAREKAVEWEKLWEEQRIAEWKVRCDALRLAQRLIERWETNEAKFGTVEGIARLLELVHKLGRAAAGMPTEPVQVTEEVSATLEIEWEVALKKVYGTTTTAQPVVDVLEAGSRDELK
jgi:hypothetical protein